MTFAKLKLKTYDDRTESPKIRGIPLGENRDHAGEAGRMVTEGDSEMESTRV